MYKWAFVIAICVSVLACQTPRQAAPTAHNDKLYKKDNNEMNAKFCVYHLNDSVSRLYYDIANDVLVYKKNDTSNYFYSACKLHYKASVEPGFKPVTDSATQVFFDRQLAVENKHLSGSIDMQLRKNGVFYMEIEVTDINKHALYTYHLYVDKSNHDVRQNFLARDLDQNIQYASYFKPGQSITLETETNPQQAFTVDYFRMDFHIAKPPFSLQPIEHFSYKPDSTFTVSKVNGKITLSLPEKGFYHVRPDANSKDGITCFVYEASFPKISNTTQMIFATRYIMAKKEFDNCMIADDKKAAIDKFWLDLGGSNERAIELIKRYYGRVQETNTLFSSHQEGWKTDRGMIYVVFGAPNSVWKRKNGEVWTYGESGNPRSIVFTFVKVINPFSDNDYMLERNEALKAPWYQAVDFWRQGRIYLDN